MTLTRRQRKILDFIRDFSDRRGYAPTLAEIGRHFGLRSPATVHKHLRNLEERGALKRRWNQSRAIELVPEEGTSRAVDLPLVGAISAGRPILLHAVDHTVPVPPGLVGEARTYALAVRGDGFRDELLRDGDLLVIEETRTPAPGALVLVLLRGNEPALRPWPAARPAAAAPRPGGAIVSDAAEARLQGRVVGLLRKY